MKNTFISLVLFCISFSACKKENKQSATKPNGKLYNVTFSLNGFTQQHSGFLGTNSIKKTSSIITDDAGTYVEVSADTLTKYQILYMSTGDTTYVEHQGDSNFGTFKTQLLAGTYTFYFICGENDWPGSKLGTGLDFQYSYKVPADYDTTFTYENLNYEGLSNYGFVNDIFLKKLVITVGNTDINQSVSLDRLVGKLDVVIQDAIPSNVNYFKIVCDGTDWEYDLKTGVISSPAEDIETFKIANSVQGTTNFDMSTLILNTIKPFTVIVSAYSGAPNTGTLIASKTISGITCSANNITILEGNLFGGTGTGAGGSITVKGDTSWNATPINYHF